MKIIASLLLFIVPFVWFYLKFYAKKLKTKMEVNLFLDNLHNELIQGQHEKAFHIFHDFSIKSMGKPDIMYELSHLPMTTRNLECLNFMKHVDDAMVTNASPLEKIVIDNYEHKT